MKIKDIIKQLEIIAPPSYQESYDNSGLIVGDANEICTKVLLCLDTTEAVVEEAMALGCQLIIAHHPIVFRGLKRFTGKNYVERTVIKAIKNDIAIYACHTNLDNVYVGVNQKISERLGLKNTKILLPKKQSLQKLTFLSPIEKAVDIRAALLNIGAQQIPQSVNSFSSLGLGSQDEQEQGMMQVEMLFPAFLQAKMLQTLHQQHPSKTPYYHITAIDNLNPHVGAGMIGSLEEPMPAMDFLKLLKKQMKTDCVKYTKLVHKTIKKVAVCGGSGMFLLSKAIGKKADIFITADFKYHEFFDANGKIIIADIGHYETEQFTMVLFKELLSKKNRNFDLLLSKINTNPVNYL